MKEDMMKLAQQEIEEALEAVETLENNIDKEDFSKDELKKKFIKLNEKVNEIESLLKSEGII
ncbi:hypothetical protein SAMN05444401_1588 [Clostridium amylolyticum]|uniref:Uncharacterized protein n=1 Tax=Clostridium amylolyticum TaxID=1121298 RepID=A0A1M6EJD3_9CLOT|nr:hypothetical protein [Clostridium amylolyticum]SHI85408.1 hypothetical protein SAMN05444401_1588 [Clostridium amylolyticum]